MWKDMIHEFTPCTFVLNFTNMILIKNLSLYREEEIGRLIAQALASGVKERRPWYEPAEKLPDQPIINAPKEEFETLVVEMPSARNATGKKSISMVENQD
jgi:hypothetical protein